MISQAEKNGIKRILQDPNWNSVQRVIDMMIQNFNDVHTSKETEWEAARGLVERDAKVQALREFVSELYKQAA